MEYQGLTLDQFQIDSIESVKKGNSVVVSAPTGSGKTLIADFIIEQNLQLGKRVIYTSPIKALSNQKYRDFSRRYGEENIGLITGDIVINPGAKTLIMTTEVYRNMVLVRDKMINEVSYVIFDEIHYINDIERGYVWEESLIFSPDNVRFLCLSATIPNADEFAAWIRSIKNHDIDVIKYHYRNVPLHQMFYHDDLGICTLKEIADIANIPRQRRRHQRDRHVSTKPNHARLVYALGETKMPILFFCFSRNACQKNAIDLAKRYSNETSAAISSFIAQKLREVPPEIGQLESTKVLRMILPKGIAFHHAGLLPVQKEIVEELFSKGLIKVLYATETFAVGINMPARTVCFEGLRKFNGIHFGYLTSKEYFQMAGRAGRRGIDKEGFVCPMIDMRDFDYKTIYEMTSEDKDPLKSQFRLSVNTVLNLVKDHTDEEIKVILDKSFFSYQNKNKKDIIERTFKNMFNKLEKMQYIQNRQLTVKGNFASKVFCDEITMAEIFCVNRWEELDNYEIMLVIACLSYEPRLRSKFYNQRNTKTEKRLAHKFDKLLKGKEEYIPDMSSIIYPLFANADFFAVLENTSLDEGDLIRIYGQVMDRINQIQRATENYDLRHRLDACFNLLKELLKDLM